MTDLSIFPTLNLSIHRHILSYLDREDRFKTVFTGSHSSRSALLYLPVSDWNLQRVRAMQRHYQSSMHTSNEVHPILGNHDLIIGRDDVIDHYYMKSLTPNCSSVKVVLRYGTFEQTFSRFSQVLIAVGSIIVPGGTVHFSGDGMDDLFPPHYRENQEVTCARVWDLLRDFQRVINARVYLEIPRCHGVNGMPHGCIPCSYIAKYMSQDVLAGLIYFQSMQSTFVHTCKRSLENLFSDYKISLQCLCGKIPMVLEGRRYLCNDATVGLLNQYWRRFDYPPSPMFGDLSFTTLHVCTAMNRILILRPVDTRFISVEGIEDNRDHCGSNPDVYFWIHDIDAEGDVDSVLSFVSDCIIEGKLLPETLINIVTGKTSAHMLKLLGSSVSGRFDFHYDDACGGDEVTVKMADIFRCNSKVIVCSQLRSFMREIGRRTGKLELEELFPEAMTMIFFDDINLYDLQGACDMLLHDSLQNKRFEYDLVFAIMAMYGRLWESSESDYETISQAEQLTVHIIVKFLRILLDRCLEEYIAGTDAYNMWLDYAYEVIFDMWIGSLDRKGGVGSADNSKDILRGRFFSRTSERSLYGSRVEKDVYGYGHILKGGYRWSDLLIVVFAFHDMTLQRKTFDMCKHAKAINDVCSSFLTNEYVEYREAFPESFPRIGINKEPSSVPEDVEGKYWRGFRYDDPNSSKVEYPEFDVSPKQVETLLVLNVPNSVSTNGYGHSNDMLWYDFCSKFGSASAVSETISIFCGAGRKRGRSIGTGDIIREHDVLYNELPRAAPKSVMMWL